jgi:O-antigen ligase
MGILAASYSRRIRDLLFALMVFSTVFMEEIDINFMVRLWYRAPAQGFQFCITDFLAWTLLLSTLLSVQRERFRLFWPASLGLMLIFAGYCSLNVLISDPKLFGLFLLSVMLRGLLVFLAVAWYVRSGREVYILIYALGAVLVYEGSLTLWQRYILGIMRVSGTFPHPNVLANNCGMIAPVLLAVTLLQTNLLVRFFCALAWMLGGIAVVLSISRMGFALFAVGTGGVMLAGMGRQISLQKAALVLVLGAAASGMLFRGYDKFESRHAAMTAAEEAGDRSTGRSVYYEMAWKMAREHPFGVGLNNWSWSVSAAEGHPYASTDSPGGGGGAIFPHTLWGQTLGELGWLGLFIFLALWFRWLALAGRNLFVRSPNLFSQVGIGCFCSIIVVALASLSSCNLYGQFMYLLFHVLIGLVAGVARIQMYSQPYRGKP